MYIQEQLQAWRTSTGLTGPCPMSVWLTAEETKLAGIDPNSLRYAIEENKIRKNLLLHPDWNTQLSWQGFRMVERYTQPRRSLAQITFLTHVLTNPFPQLGMKLKGFLQRDIDTDTVTNPLVLKLVEDYLAIAPLLPREVRYTPSSRVKSPLSPDKIPRRILP